jgi:hypothetical protein
MTVDGFIGGAAVTEEIMESPFGCINRDIQVAGKHVKPPDMIPVFMGDQHRPDLPCIKGRLFHSPESFFRAQSCINKKCPALTLEIYAIAFAPAGKNRAAHRPIIGRSRIRVFNSSPFFLKKCEKEELSVIFGNNMDGRGFNPGDYRHANSKR